MNTTILTDEQIIRILEENRPEYDGPDKAIAVSRAIEQAVLQSPEIQRLKAIESAAEKVLGMPQEDGYIVLTVHLDALRTAMEEQT